MPLVRSVRLPIVLAENACTLPTIEAAKSEPGKCGRETLPPPGDEGAETVEGLGALGR